MASTGEPRRRASDHHVHIEYWTQADQHRFEDRLAREVDGVRDEVKSLNNRLTMMLGGLAILAFLIPIAAPFVRDLLGIPVGP